MKEFLIQHDQRSTTTATTAMAWFGGGEACAGNETPPYGTQTFSGLLPGSRAHMGGIEKTKYYKTSPCLFGVRCRVDRRNTSLFFFFFSVSRITASSLRSSGVVNYSRQENFVFHFLHENDLYSTLLIYAIPVYYYCSERIQNGSSD